MRLRCHGWSLRLAGYLMLLSASTAGADPAILRGAAFYRHGTVSAGPPATLRLGDGEQLLPATMLPCQGCHGAHGEGGSEGGVPAPSLRRAALDHPRTDGPRPRPAYTATLLIRAITQGYASDGRELNAAMPRYGLSRDTAEDLLAWLRTLDQASEPGISEREILLGFRGQIAVPELPVAPIYGRRLRWLSTSEPASAAFAWIDVGEDADTPAVEVPRLSLWAAGTLGPAGFALLDASTTTQHAALAAIGHGASVRFAIDPPCRDWPAVELVLLSAIAAANCSALLQPPSTVTVLVAVRHPPEPAFVSDAASLMRDILVQALADLGHTPTRAGLVQWLERYDRPAGTSLPALRWRRDRHVGAMAAWVMTLEPHRGRLLAQPGWVTAEDRPEAQQSAR